MHLSRASVWATLLAFAGKRRGKSPCALHSRATFSLGFDLKSTCGCEFRSFHCIHWLSFGWYLAVLHTRRRCGGKGCMDVLIYLRTVCLFLSLKNKCLLLLQRRASCCLVFGSVLFDITLFSLHGTEVTWHTSGSRTSCMEPVDVDRLHHCLHVRVPWLDMVCFTCLLCT